MYSHIVDIKLGTLYYINEADGRFHVFAYSIWFFSTCNEKVYTKLSKHLQGLTLDRSLFIFIFLIVENVNFVNK